MNIFNFFKKADKEVELRERARRAEEAKGIRRIDRCGVIIPEGTKEEEFECKYFLYEVCGGCKYGVKAYYGKKTFTTEEEYNAKNVN